jgi:hypothetical protein
MHYNLYALQDDRFREDNARDPVGRIFTGTVDDANQDLYFTN